MMVLSSPPNVCLIRTIRRACPWSLSSTPLRILRFALPQQGTVSAPPLGPRLTSPLLRAGLEKGLAHQEIGHRDSGSYTEGGGARTLHPS